MVISRTPFRISFFGGGTDFPAWYRDNGGAVLSTTIDKYCYISCRHLPPFFNHRHRIVYSKIELVKEINEIQHPAVREICNFLNITRGIEVHHEGDLPARSGMGSSSSFSVGLLHALYSLNGIMVSKRQLALNAIHVEQEIIKENVGSQDQVAVAFGGFNKIEFAGNHDIKVTPMSIRQSRVRELQDHLLLFFTGVNRTASDIEGEKIKNLHKKHKELKTLHTMVDEAINILNSDRAISDFGKLLLESWKLKRTFSDKVTTAFVDSAYDTGLKNGAVGGKILGAGGGGFLLLFAAPENHKTIIGALNTLLYVPFKFDTLGSHIIYYQNDSDYKI